MEGCGGGGTKVAAIRANSIGPEGPPTSLQDSNESSGSTSLSFRAAAPARAGTASRRVRGSQRSAPRAHCRLQSTTLSASVP
ncbi:DUF6053 domain-containing protein [Lysobacter enzymogenes]|uniref:DUF6053 domain-containing protein n=1 Tax=Lysobacter enzymogenes TaxID=69 RepID=UPI0037480EF3